MALIKLILLEDVENLGLAGDEVNVAPGYARNFLVPKGLAAKATSGTLRVLAARKEKIEAHRKQELEAAKTLAVKIAEADVTIPMQASGDDKLFGSVSARNIADKLAELGLHVDHLKLKMEEPIKQLGKFEIEVKLHHDVTPKLKVWVVRA
ncbi:MAG: 50S ribosomal protein L9 [Victivallaceae bacterium]|jgi:large subunit ribosomal protein L9